MQRIGTLAAVVVLIVSMVNVLAHAADAKFHRWKDKSGVIHYTDTPPPDDAVVEDAKSTPQGAPLGDAKTERLRMSMIDEALAASGMRSEFDQLAVAVKTGFEMGSGAAGKTEQGLAVLKVLLDAFRPDRFYPAFQKRFRGHLDDEYLATTLAFYRSPVGKKIARLTAEGAPKNASEMRTFAAQVGAQPALQSRVPLIRRLDEAAGIGDLGLESAVTTFKTAVQAIAEIAPADRRPSADQIDEMAFEFRRRAADEIRQAAVLRMFYVLRAVPEDDVQRYLNFAESDAGRWYSTALRASLIDTIGAVAETLRVQLARTVAPRATTAPPAGR